MSGSRHAALLVLTALVVASCSGDDDATTTSTVAGDDSPATAGADDDRAASRRRPRPTAAPDDDRPTSAGAGPLDGAARVGAGRRARRRARCRSSSSSPPTATWPATGVVDDLGSLLFRTSTPAATRCAPTTPATAPFEVAPLDELPPPSFYAEQQLPAGGFGYLETRDGTTLSVNVVLPGPAEAGPVPDRRRVLGLRAVQPGRRRASRSCSPPSATPTSASTCAAAVAAAARSASSRTPSSSTATT